jgi:acyl dehydratase
LSVPIDVEAALAARFPTVTSSWDADRVVLYHLGIGAASDGLDTRSLRFVWEERLVVLPTFGVVPASDAAVHAGTCPALAVDATDLLQGSHEIVVHEPLPVAATVRTDARIERIEDTGRHAIVTVTTTTCGEDGDLLVTNRFVLLLRGAGGFGGDVPKPPESFDPPAHALADLVCATLPNQTALYRLSGDRTPLHIDPVAARAAGFAAPPLPGLCTLGIIGRRVVEDRFDGDPSPIAALRARFDGPVYPGETLVVRLWPSDTGLRFDAHVLERGARAVSHGAVALR